MRTHPSIVHLSAGRVSLGKSAATALPDPRWSLPSGHALRHQSRSRTGGDSSASPTSAATPSCCSTSCCLPVLSVLTEGHPKAEMLAMVAEQIVFLGAAAALGGRRMLVFGMPPGVRAWSPLAATFAAGEIPVGHYSLWAIARAISFIVPILTVGLLILVDVLAAKRIVFDMICGACACSCCLACAGPTSSRCSSGSPPAHSRIDFARYHVDAGATRSPPPACLPTTRS